MGRAIAAVLIAETVWTVLWLGGGQAAAAAFPAAIDLAQPLTNPLVLTGFLAYSVAVSVISGFVCAAVRGAAAMKTVWGFAFIQLALGVGFEASSWALTPVWYHLVFLALLVPSVVWGGRLRTGGVAAAAT